MSFGKSYFEPVYLISEVSTILNIHPQTLRQYEREGLVLPSRTNGKIRLYSQKDIDIIKNILYLTREEGVNLAGVRLILQLQDKINILESKLNDIKQTNSIEASSKALVVKQQQYDLVIIS